MTTMTTTIDPVTYECLAAAHPNAPYSQHVIAMVAAAVERRVRQVRAEREAAGDMTPYSYADARADLRAPEPTDGWDLSDPDASTETIIAAIDYELRAR